MSRTLIQKLGFWFQHPEHVSWSKHSEHVLWLKHLGLDGDFQNNNARGMRQLPGRRPGQNGMAMARGNGNGGNARDNREPTSNISCWYRIENDHRKPKHAPSSRKIAVAWNCSTRMKFSKVSTSCRGVASGRQGSATGRGSQRGEVRLRASSVAVAFNASRGVFGG